MFYHEIEKIGREATAAISAAVKSHSDVIGLHYGAPLVGPPNYLCDTILREDLTDTAFLTAVKTYEQSRGSSALREAIAHWYQKRHQLKIDPNREIIITNGSVEAFTLAILATTNVHDNVLLSDPSYMLFENVLATLNRQSKIFLRNAGNMEFKILRDIPLDDIRAIVLNSPENPTGYIISPREWQHIADSIQQYNMWLIHDEVLDTVDFHQQYIPASKIDTLKDKTVLINGLSKTFGMPGLRIGWMIAPEAIIQKAVDAHNDLYLGVNTHYEPIATRVLSDDHIIHWLNQNSKEMHARAQHAVSQLTPEHGYTWDRVPAGGLCGFPNIAVLYQQMPQRYRINHCSKAAAVANYLFQEKKVAVTPGSLYGKQGRDYIKIALCGDQQQFYQAIDRLIN